MALTTKNATTAACNSCRQLVLRSFIASIGGTPTPRHQRRTFAVSTTRWKEEHALNDINTTFPSALGRQRNGADTIRSSTLATPKLREQDDEYEVTGEQLLEMQEMDEAIAKERAQAKAERRLERAAKDDGENVGQSVATEQSEHVPWYLQVQSPLPPTESSLSARQQIPDLPSHSPSLLEPLMQHVSVDLGMDDLTLLDLRELDPPPALGANLFMLVGTARSERHLHVSADKLCRWLRSQHKLTPFADGLLGRQELKVKLRRRAKRARLMSAVGAKGTNETELDEGIRTGWVCVNIGRIEGGELPKTQAEIEAESKIVGFGTKTTGCHVVVQLMTEEKRGALDLEKLWTDMLNRSRKAKQELFRKEEQEADMLEAGKNEQKDAGVDKAVHETVFFSPEVDSRRAEREART
ncbi:ATPase synthesis protein 25 [Cercospora zeina]